MKLCERCNNHEIYDEATGLCKDCYEYFINGCEEKHKPIPRCTECGIEILESEDGLCTRCRESEEERLSMFFQYDMGLFD